MKYPRRDPDYESYDYLYKILWMLPRLGVADGDWCDPDTLWTYRELALVWRDNQPGGVWDE